MTSRATVADSDVSFGIHVSAPRTGLRSERTSAAACGPTRGGVRRRTRGQRVGDQRSSSRVGGSGHGGPGSRRRQITILVTSTLAADAENDPRSGNAWTNWSGWVAGSGSSERSAPVSRIGSRAVRCRPRAVSRSHFDPDHILTRSHFRKAWLREPKRKSSQHRDSGRRVDTRRRDRRLSPRGNWLRRSRMCPKRPTASSRSTLRGSRSSIRVVCEYSSSLSNVWQPSVAVWRCGTRRGSCPGSSRSRGSSRHSNSGDVAARPPRRNAAESPGAVVGAGGSAAHRARRASRRAQFAVDCCRCRTASISSPLRRARDTAAAFGRPVEIDERWIELDYGELDGRPPTSVPEELWARWRCGFLVRPTRRRVAVRRCRAGWPRHVRNCRRRPPTSTVVVVTHVSPIKAALAWALDVPIGISWRMYVEDASVSRIDVGPDGPVVRWFNRGDRASRLSASKKASAVSLHVGSDAPRRRAATASVSSPLVVGGEAAQGATQAGDVAGFDEAPLLAVLDEVGQVAGPPADRREPRGQRFGEDGAVRLGVARQDERVGTGVQPGDLLSRRPVRGRRRGPARSGALESSLHAVRCSGASTSVRPTRCSVSVVGRQGGDRVEQFEDALVRAASCRRTALRSGVRRAGRRPAPRRAACRCPGSTTQTRSAGRPYSVDEVVRERRARGDQQIAASVEQLVHRALQRRADAHLARRRRVAGGGSRRSVRRGRRRLSDPRRDRPRGEAVDEHHARAHRGSGLRRPVEMNSIRAPRAAAASAIRRW